MNDILSDESEKNKIFAYMKISLKTRYNTKKYTKSDYLPYATDERNVVEELYIKKLDTMALVVKEGIRKNCYRVLFLYDNINYSFLIIFPTEKSNNSLKIKNILNSLEY